MLQLLSEHACFGGVQRFYTHPSKATGLPMRFSVFLPKQAGDDKLPALFFLAGLTCSEDTFMVKGGAQRVAAERGMILVTLDTSPRGAGIENEAASWDFGLGAGFYLDATEPPWNTHYNMHSYVLELYALLIAALPLDPARIGIFGHSMGGHGALVLALRHPELFRSVSAFAPICAPSQCAWGKNAFSKYLGDDTTQWQQYDASALMASRHRPFPNGILIDQGLADQFLAEQLMPEAFEQACDKARQPLRLRRHAGYDHGYFFVSTFMEEHIRFHADQ